MKKSNLLIIIMLVSIMAKAQDITLKFTANHSCTHHALDSIWIENLTQHGKMVLYYPDTIASFVLTDIEEFETWNNNLHVSQNYPNPFSAITYVEVYLTTPDVVSLTVFDMTGRIVAKHEDMLEGGMHRFSFSAGMETTYILTVNSGKHVEKRIMLQMGAAESAGSEISYLGASSEIEPKTAPKSSDFSFNPGDNLRFTGFVTDLAGNVDYAVINDAPEASTEYLFDIANNPPSQPSEISGDDYVPVNATGLIYEVEEHEGLTYLWSVPDGWEITHGQGSHAITVNAGSEGGDVLVKAENACGLSESRVLSVDVYVLTFELTLSAFPLDGGAVSGEGHYEESEQVSITASPNHQWGFANWTGDTDYIDDPTLANATVIMPQYDITLTANFYEDSNIIYGDGVTDIDGNEYVTVIIGDQEWMAENLRVTGDAEGNDITRYCYDNDPDWCDLYGGLYTWNTAMNGESSSSENPSGVQGICPTGWHVPSDAEWTELVNYLDSQGFPNSDVVNGAGNALKSCRQVGSPLEGCNTSEHPRWNSHGTHYGFDEFGFSALPGGFRLTDGSFYYLGTIGYWWSSTEYSSTRAWYRYMWHFYGNVHRSSSNKPLGFSLRCVRVID